MLLSLIDLGHKKAKVIEHVPWKDARGYLNSDALYFVKGDQIRRWKAALFHA